MQFEKRIVNVQAAGIWTAADSPRAIDRDAISSPAKYGDWVKSLDYEKKLQLCDDNLLQTQALFGEEVIVKGYEGDWVRVAVPSQPSAKDADGYPGWMPAAQLTAGEGQIKSGNLAAVTAADAILYTEDGTELFPLSFQTELPALAADTEWITVQTPLGKGKIKRSSAEIFSQEQGRPKLGGKAVLGYGRMFLGLSYLWGGMSSFGYDCSGFSHMMCKAAGYVIPRDAGDQAHAGARVDLSKIQPGDLLFFAYKEGKGEIHHVGLYEGNGKLLHSPKTGKSIESISLSGTLYERELCTAVRYWEGEVNG